MRLWPFKRESRAQRDYTARIVAAGYEGSTLPGEIAMATAALEVCAGFYQRAFQSARVTGATPAVERAVTPTVLGIVGRNLIRHGEAAFAIDVRDGALTLTPVADFDVQEGASAPETWNYRATMAGPSRQTTRSVPSAGMVHCRYSVSSSAPWRGIGPLRWAHLSADVIARVERSLHTEMDIPPAAILPVSIPTLAAKDEGVGTTDELFRQFAGKVHMVEHAAGWADMYGKDGRSQLRDSNSGWRPIYLHPEPEQSTVMLRDAAAMAVIAAAGVPPGLVQPNSDGTSQREGWRRFLHGSLAPVAENVAGELRDKLDSPDLALNFDSLFASDLTGRARAYAQMVKAGRSPEEAARLSGLIEGDD